MNPVDAKILLAEIEKSSHKSNRWEISFLREARRLIEDGMYLSQKQSDALQSVYRKSQSGNYAFHQVV